MVVAAGPLHGRHKARIAPAGSSNQERDSGKDGRALVLASSRFAHEGKKNKPKRYRGARLLNKREIPAVRQLIRTHEQDGRCQFRRLITPLE